MRIHISEHLRDIKRPLNKYEKGREKENPLAQHFKDCHAGKTEGLKVKGIFVLDLPLRRGDFEEILLHREKYWIYNLNSLIPKGLNIECNMNVFLDD